jgi:hippurate hydrolase
LAKHRNFAGKVHLIFQPAEEGGAGAKRMIDEGLFELFPIDSIWGLHNWPPVKLGKVTFCAGPMMASADELQFTLIGKGSHAARPHLSKDPILAAAQLIQAVQNLISREINPFDQAVISLCTIQGGSATNVIPDKVEIGGTLRSFSPAVRDHLVKRLYEVCRGLSQTSGVDIQMAIVGEAYPATINTALESQIAEEVAQEIFGTEHVNTTMEPSMGAEDFSYMLQQVPGCYIRLGSGITDHDPTLHQTNFNFNDAAIPLGASYFIKLVEKNLSHSV